MSGLKLNTASSGSVTLEPTNTASNYTLTVPAQTGTVAINGPAFSAYQSVAQTGITNATSTKLTFDVEEYDTNNNFASSRFTPTVAGYYQINGGVQLPSTSSSNSVLIQLYKNGTNYRNGASPSGNNALFPEATISSLVYLNGSTDYVEMYVYGYVSGSSVSTGTGVAQTYFSGSMVRAA